MKINIKAVPMCASCRYWDDPTRSAMKPTVGKNLWEIDTSQRRLCMKRRIKMKAAARCRLHEFKVDVF
jgi:hypothetical protein